MSKAEIIGRLDELLDAAHGKERLLDFTDIRDLRDELQRELDLSPKADV